MRSSGHTASDLLLLAQGVYYLGTGIWPLLHMRSFERVTGPKADKWLVRTVGVLVTAVGASLLTARGRPGTERPAAVLGAGSAAGLAGIDIAHVATGTIAPIYLADALLEAGIVAAWVAALKHPPEAQRFRNSFA